MMLAVTTLATLLASASAFASHHSPSVSVVVHHINSTITPPRCGETTVRGSAQYQSVTTAFMRKTFALANGTCASVGYGVRLQPSQLDEFPKRIGCDSSGCRVDMPYTLKYKGRYNSGKWSYMIKFFHQGASSGGKGGQAPSVVGLAVATPTLSTLVAAVKAGGLVGALSAKGPFTVFAPTNAAFAALGAAVPTLLKPANKALLDKVLEYHVIAGQTVLASQIKDGMTAKTLEGQQLTFGIDDGVVSVDDATVSKANIMASNGVVHVINKVLLFPGFKLPASTGGKGGACVNDASFSDSYGNCAAYASHKWCANGKPGSAWQSSWGSLSAAVTKACCACAGGGGSEKPGGTST